MYACAWLKELGSSEGAHPIALVYLVDVLLRNKNIYGVEWEDPV